MASRRGAHATPLSSGPGGRRGYRRRRRGASSPPRAMWHVRRGDVRRRSAKFISLPIFALSDGETRCSGPTTVSLSLSLSLATEERERALCLESKPTIAIQFHVRRLRSPLRLTFPRFSTYLFLFFSLRRDIARAAKRTNDASMFAVSDSAGSARDH